MKDYNTNNLYDLEHSQEKHTSHIVQKAWCIHLEDEKQNKRNQKVEDDCT